MATSGYKKMKYKQIILKITNVSPGQMLTLKGELNIMSRAWKRFGPEIEIKTANIKEPSSRPQKNIRLW